MNEPINNINDQAKAFNALGDSLCSELKYAEAAKAYKKAYDACTSDNRYKIYYKDNSMFAQSKAFYEEAEFLIKDGLFAAAAEKLQLACETCPTTRENNLKQFQNKKAFALMNLALSFEKDKNYSEALKTIKESMKICSNDSVHQEIIESAQKLIKASILGEKAESLLEGKNYQKAFFAYQSAFENCPEENIKRRELFVNGEIKSLFDGWLDYGFSSGLTVNTLEEVFQDAKSDLLKRKIKKYQTLILMHIGNGQQYKGKFDRAVQEYDEAFMIARDDVNKDFCVKMIQKIAERREREDLKDEFENDLVELTNKMIEFTREFLEKKEENDLKKDSRFALLMVKFLQRSFNKITRVIGEVKNFEAVLNELKNMTTEIIIENDDMFRSDKKNNETKRINGLTKGLILNDKESFDDNKKLKVNHDVRDGSIGEIAKSFWEEFVNDVINFIADNLFSFAIAFAVFIFASYVLRN